MGRKGLSQKGRSAKRRSSRKRRRSKRSSRSGRRSTSDLVRRMNKLNPGRKPLSSPKDSRLKRGKKPRPSNIKFPSIPKRSLPKIPKTKSACGQLELMRKKYREGQKLIDEVDRFMGKK